MYTISKLFELEMAHMLDASYSKECQRIHGHSYKLEVQIKSISLNGYGMVIDFKDLKEIVNKEIISNYDHYLVVSTLHSSVPAIFDSSVVYVAYNPTAENMAKHFHTLLWPFINDLCSNLVSLTIKLWETRTGYVEYS